MTLHAYLFPKFIVANVYKKQIIKNSNPDEISLEKESNLTTRPSTSIDRRLGTYGWKQVVSLTLIENNYFQSIFILNYHKHSLFIDFMLFCYMIVSQQEKYRFSNFSFFVCHMTFPQKVNLYIFPTLLNCR